MDEHMIIIHKRLLTPRKIETLSRSLCDRGRAITCDTHVISKTFIECPRIRSFAHRTQRTSESRKSAHTETCNQIHNRFNLAPSLLSFFALVVCSRKLSRTNEKAIRWLSRCLCVCVFFPSLVWLKGNRHLHNLTKVFGLYAPYELCVSSKWLRKNRNHLLSKPNHHIILLSSAAKFLGVLRTSKSMDGLSSPLPFRPMAIIFVSLYVHWNPRWLHFVYYSMRVSGPFVAVFEAWFFFSSLCCGCSLLNNIQKTVILLAYMIRVCVCCECVC